MAVTTINAIMQMRRGLEEDLDITKLHVGEWALSTDTKYVRICYAQNKVVQLATQDTMDAVLAQIEEVFEQTVEEIEADVTTVEEYMGTTLIYKNAAAASASDASDSATTATNKATQASNSATLAESWAVGGTGTRTGEDTNNAKYWAEHSTIPAGGTTGQVLAKKSNSDRDTEWVNQSGGGTSGHKILDSSGTEMADESKLQFNGLDVSDDSTNGKTIVSHNINTDAPTFTEAQTRANISSGENIATLFGKIKKFFTDLKTVAFTGSYSDLSNTPTIPSDLEDLGDVAISSPSNGQVVKYNSTTSKWENANESGGGSGGHTILDADGTAMTARTNLQMGGYLRTSDDSQNNKTVVTDEPVPITWDAWRVKSDAEKEGTHWVISDAPNIDGGIDTEVMTKLWENPNPSVDFAEQSITLSSDDYDFLLFEARYSRNGSRIGDSIIIPKGVNGFLSFPDYSGGASNIYRSINRSSNTSLTITDAYVNGTKNNAYLVPVSIYGIKKSIHLDISAIVSDVSTSADKCMMDDGETSVEDAIDELQEVQTETYAPLYQYTAAHVFRFKKVGKTVIMTGCVFKDTCPINQEVELFTITNSDFIPEANYSSNFIDPVSKNIGNIQVKTDGKVILYIYASSQATYRASSAQLMYFTN